MAGFTERKIGIEFGQILWPVHGLEWRSDSVCALTWASSHATSFPCSFYDLLGTCRMSPPRHSAQLGASNHGRALRQGDRRLDHAHGFGLPVRLLAPIGARGKRDDHAGSQQPQLGRIHPGVEDLQPELDQTLSARRPVRLSSAASWKGARSCRQDHQPGARAHGVDVEQAGDQAVRNEQLAFVEVAVGRLQARLRTGQAAGNLSDQPP